MAPPNTDSTPHKETHEGHARYRQYLADASLAQKEYGTDMIGSWIGPYMPQHFFDDFMEISDADLNAMDQSVKFPLPSKAKQGKNQEKHLYGLFETSIIKYNLSPRFHFFIAADGQPEAGDVRVRPDGGVSEGTLQTRRHHYNTRGIQQNLVIPDPDPADTKGKPVEGSRRAFNWHVDNLVVEFKKSHTMDPFYTAAEIEERERAVKKARDEGNKDAKCKEGFEKDLAAALKVRGQLARYASLVFLHQQRTHIFQLLVCGQLARFIRWDHSGAVVSDAFDYNKNPHLLAQFFWRYNHMTAPQRGWDLSVTEASDKEKKTFKSVMSKFLNSMRDPARSEPVLRNAEATIDEHWPVLKVTVEDDKLGKSVRILIQAPFFRSHSALGRATRGYIAYHIPRRELIFFKDTWRVVHGHLIPERMILRSLSDASVPCIPEVLSGGDVTLNDERDSALSSRWVQRICSSMKFLPPRAFRHHRLLQPLAYPVQCAPNSKLFIIGFRDCFKAMGSAKKQCGLVHRDISLGNIMIKVADDGEVTGILADWDHAGTLASCQETEHQNFRTGTWQFMSIGLLTDPEKQHDILDDFEASFWSLLYGASHYYAHDFSSLNLGIFDEKTREPLPEGKRVSVGGTGKRCLILKKVSDRVRFVSKPLTDLIDKMASLWNEYYTAEENLNQARAEASKPSRASAASVVSKNRQWDDDEQTTRENHGGSLFKKDPIEKASEHFDAIRNELSKPSTWLDLFDDVLEARQDWPTNDSLGKDAYPPVTANDALKKLQTTTRSSFVTGSEIISREEARGLISGDTAVGATYTGAKIIPDRDAQPVDYAADPSDVVHYGEGENYEQDVEGITDPFESEPIQYPDPILHPPQASSSRLPPSSFSGFRGSSRLKRSIDEVSPHVEKIEQPTESPVPKKSRTRSQTRTKALPESAKRVTRSSSRRVTDPPRPAQPVEPAKNKESRPRRVPKKSRSGDLGGSKREGLRPRTAKSESTFTGSRVRMSRDA